MMKTVKRKVSRWKVAVLVPSIAGALAFVACQDQVMSDLKTVAENSSMALDVPQPVQDRYDALRAANPDTRYAIMELQKDAEQQLQVIEEKYGLPSSIEVFRSDDGVFNYSVFQKASDAGARVTYQVHYTGEIKTEARTFAILEYNDQVVSLSKNAVEEGGVYLVVEETAHPKEGMEKFYAFVSENMSYPTEARKAGITGRVFIEFVVEKDGTLTNFKALKGIGHGCDDEAIRVVALSPPWNPGLQKGQPVRQKMVLPVVFNL